MNTSRSSLKSIKLEEMVKNNYRKLDHYVEKLNSFRTRLNHNKTVQESMILVDDTQNF